MTSARKAARPSTLCSFSAESAGPTANGEEAMSAVCCMAVGRCVVVCWELSVWVCSSLLRGGGRSAGTPTTPVEGPPKYLEITAERPGYLPLRLISGYIRYPVIPITVYRRTSSTSPARGCTHSLCLVLQRISDLLAWLLPTCRYLFTAALPCPRSGVWATKHNTRAGL